MHGHTTTWYNFWHILKLLLFPSFWTSSRKISFAHCFIWYFVLFHICICSTRGRRDSPWEQCFWWKQKGLITLITGCMFQNIALSSDFMHIFMILYMYIALWQGQTTHYGQNFYVNRKASSFLLFVASLKTISSTSDFIHIFSCFNVLINVYSRRSGADNPQGSKCWCQQKPLITLVICYKFKKISLKTDFIHIFSWWQPLGDEILMSTETSCHFIHLLQVSKYKDKQWSGTSIIRSHILPSKPKGK